MIKAQSFTAYHRGFDLIGDIAGYWLRILIEIFMLLASGSSPSMDKIIPKLSARFKCVSSSQKEVGDYYRMKSILVYFREQRSNRSEV